MSAKPSPVKPRGRRPAVEDFDVREHMLDMVRAIVKEDASLLKALAET